MHYRMYVTTTLSDDANSEDARKEVFNYLAADDSFCGEGGRFGSPLCDFFEIGGRWSGHLAQTVIGESLRKAIIERFPPEGDEWCPHSLVVSHGDELDALWQAHGGTGKSPYTRNSNAELGQPDDAMLLTRELYDALLAGYESESFVMDDFHCKYIDLDKEPLRPEAIGQKWLVVVDYHN